MKMHTRVIITPMLVVRWSHSWYLWRLVQRCWSKRNRERVCWSLSILYHFTPFAIFTSSYCLISLFRSELLIMNYFNELFSIICIFHSAAVRASRLTMALSVRVGVGRGLKPARRSPAAPVTLRAPKEGLERGGGRNGGPSAFPAECRPVSG